MRIEPRDHGFRAVHLAIADIVGAEDHLTLQVGQRHFVVVDHAQRADAGGGEIEQHRRAEAAGADHQHPGGFQLGLAGPAHFAQHDVAGVTFEFGSIEHQG